jgi:hypothetical protein
MCVVVAMTCVRGFECELFNVCVQLLSLDRPQQGETSLRSVDAGTKKRSFHILCHLMCALCVAWLKGRGCELSSSVT